MFKSIREKEELLLLDIGLCNKIYRKGIWSEDFLETIMIPLAKKRNAKSTEL